MSYQIIFFETQNQPPVEEFLFNLDNKTFAKCLKIINLLEAYGLSIGMPYVKKISKILFELKIKGQVEVRFLFVLKYGQFYLLHGFIKKRQKIMTKDIYLANKRLTMI